MGNRGRIRVEKGMFCGLLALALTGAAWADVTVERTVKTGGIGGIGASESTAVEKVSGLRKREVHTTRLTGGLGGFLGKIAGDMGSDSITDVGKDKVWKLDHKKKSYQEESLSAAFRDLKKEEQKASPDDGKQPEKSDVRVVKNEITVKETGEKKSINGFPCAEYVITWLLETEDVKTKERSVTVMTTNLWNTPETRETRAVAKEEAEFTKAYLEKMGIDVPGEPTREFGLAMVARLFGGDDKSLEKGALDLREKMGKIKGFTIASSVKWEANAGSGTREARPRAAEPPPSSGGLGGVFGLAKKLMGGSQEAEPAKPERAEGGATPLFDSYTEIKRIDVSSIPGVEFELPAGYKPTR